MFADVLTPSREEKLETTTARWTVPQKIAFRFLFILFGLFIIIQNNGAFPFWSFVMKWPTEGLHILIPKIGKHILDLPYDITIFTNGSGDTTYDYVILFTISLTAIAATMLWSVFDRNRAHYNTLYYWLTVAVRFYVGVMLINYGMVKVFKLQFPYPGPFRLMQNYGASSPMGLAWTFLGFSKGYNLFMGVAEMAAVLLLFRRTMTLGAIITLGTTANVMAVNYFYDVPVKILSTALFLMTLFLLSHDASRLYKFFLKGQSVKLPVLAAPLIKAHWLRTSLRVCKLLYVGTVVIFAAYQSYNFMAQYGDEATRSELYGLYNVDTFIRGADTLPPITTDASRWRHLMIEYQTYALVKYMNDTITGFGMSLDTTLHTLNLFSADDSRCFFKYERPDNDHLILSGVIVNDSVSVMLNKVTDFRKKFRLTNRGFHWVNEFPYNR